MILEPPLIIKVPLVEIRSGGMKNMKNWRFLEELDCVDVLVVVGMVGRGRNGKSLLVVAVL